MLGPSSYPRHKSTLQFLFAPLTLIFPISTLIRLLFLPNKFFFWYRTNSSILFYVCELNWFLSVPWLIKLYFDFSYLQGVIARDWIVIKLNQLRALFMQTPKSKPYVCSTQFLCEFPINKKCKWNRNYYNMTNQNRKPRNKRPTFNFPSSTSIRIHENSKPNFIIKIVHYNLSIFLFL